MRETLTLTPPAIERLANLPTPYLHPSRRLAALTDAGALWLSVYRSALALGFGEDRAQRMAWNAARNAREGRLRVIRP